MRLILHRNFKWRALSRKVRREQRNREHYSPTISTYRWWARRSHALIGALLDQSRKVLGQAIVVSDPMAGGGTVAVEAARRGLVVHAQDVNPWAAFGLRTTLQPVDPVLLEQAATRLIERLDRLGRQLYQVDGQEELLSCLHVRHCTCPACGGTNYLFPTRLLALDRRIVAEPSAGWFGCPACGTVQHDHWPEGPARCNVCHHEFTDRPDEKRIENLVVMCAQCATKNPLTPEALQTATWKPVLSVVQKNRKLELHPSTVGGTPSRRQSAIAAKLAKRIPGKGETAALQRGGFVEWAELFPDRQLAMLDEAFSALDAEELSVPVRQRLLLAVAGFAEMAGYACRWDPKYRKVYEVTSNHHYTRSFLTAETNPAAAMGRGTLPRRLAQAVKAAQWFPGSDKATVTCGSSVAQPMADASVDLVITDPPYYDSIQYAELSRLFRVFAQALGLNWDDRVENDEAVPNRHLGCSHEQYVTRLTAIFAETRRTLKRSGRMLLTFHDSKILAWQAIGDALRDSAWKVVSVAVVHSENEKDFAKNEKNAIAVDAVFECVPRQIKPARVATAGALTNNSAKNVLAIGAAVAAYVNGSAPHLKPLYMDQARRRGIKKLTLN
ncbi:DNA methyltransferase [Opitutus terrae]|uniref:Adenine-specific DNA methylase containing a Zn-ribbon-like protein n=1 Tax=Opitutus terrae (strain DSM 11246 / JCM 15787 / PB90-1) TaxID=452637 RepID=B1ZPF1_OPITP|nr:DNA methyltransferase [Opitutus terrae]ACB74470.1 Adenine-specific DNA methylase containing a Zn-ribbon-like protein [Opitutus terrae PB90-1]